MAATAPSTSTKPSFSLLDGHQYMNLTTYRKNGEESTRPVWFAEDNGKIYMLTVDGSWKIKHIQRNPEVFVSPSDARGTPLSEERAAGIAAVYEKGHPTATHANAVLTRKYGLIKRLFSISFLFRRSTVVWIEIEPR
jgi:PPOX class probable F420-dependent enzyme